MYSTCVGRTFRMSMTRVRSCVVRRSFMYQYIATGIYVDFRCHVVCFRRFRWPFALAYRTFLWLCRPFRWMQQSSQISGACARWRTAAGMLFSTPGGATDACTLSRCSSVSFALTVDRTVSIYVRRMMSRVLHSFVKDSPLRLVPEEKTCVT